jgi:sugar O-acyltransferase (sialic acid O-acetyltransferase NeuD family)
VAVIGAGPHGRVVAATLVAAGHQVAGFYDDAPATWGKAIGHSTVLGSPTEIPPGSAAIIAIGDNEARKRVAENLDLEWVTVVHPFSWIDPDIAIGRGTVVCSGVTAQNGASIGSHVILNNRSGVGHDARVADYAHIVVSHLGSKAHAGEGAFLCIGSVVLPGVQVGAWSTVGAGAVVIEDVPLGATVVGNPAHPLHGRGDRASAETDPGR